MEKNTIENLTNYIFSVQSLVDRLNIMQKEKRLLTLTSGYLFIQFNYERKIVECRM